MNSIKVRIYPNKEMTSNLNQLLGCNRFIYNELLDFKLQAYEFNKTNMISNDLSKYFHSILLPQYSFLQNFNSNILKENVLIIQNSFTSFYKGVHGFPQFKKKSDEQSCKFRRPTSII